METYRETINSVKVGDKKTENFWTKRGVRQGCPMSLTLFNIYVMDLEKEMRKEQAGGVTIGKEKFWSLTYTDDMVLVARNEEDLKGMLKRFRRYLSKKRLTLNVEKSKIIVFENGKGRKKRREWRWREEIIEEVTEIKYLEYIMQKNGGAEKHVIERFKRAMIAMKKTWSIGEKIFGNDYKRREKMFDALVGSVALYGAEIWGWKNETRLDRIKRKYVKWILGLDIRTPNYILIEETKMIEIRIEAIKRAIIYEEKARNSEKKLVVECIKDLEKVKTRKEGKWEAARGDILKRIGIDKEEIKRERERGNQEIVNSVLTRI